MRSEATWIVVLAMAFGCDVSDRAEHPRQALFGLESTDPVAQELTRPARLTALYFPNLDSCAPMEASIVRALRDLESEYEDVRILTVLPEHYSGTREIYGEALPGATITVRSISHHEQSQIAPIPRLEVWSAEEELLLLRSVPSAITEEEIYNELLWTLSFTRPVDEASAAF